MNNKRKKNSNAPDPRNVIAPENPVGVKNQQTRECFH
jgi:hypothetical protein